ncbi:unannotated protein [freshwater metagenome]|uniref:Unannotated protein n=1 Tax=freshwater metagenome TaxID=449393 RepID=A0A6J7T1X8_9ZZZZ
MAVVEVVPVSVVVLDVVPVSETVTVDVPEELEVEELTLPSVDAVVVVLPDETETLPLGVAEALSPLGAMTEVEPLGATTKVVLLAV